MRHGTVRILLAKLMKESGRTKGEVSRIAEMERTQFNHYCKSDITRVDLDVLARLCNALGCDISDLLEYVPEDRQ